MLRRISWYVAGATLLALLLAFWGLRPVPSAPRTIGTQVGQLAPDFTLPRLGGKGSIRLWSLRGHPVWLNFFASWCPPCNAEAPGLVKVANQNPGLYLIGVDLEGSEKSVADVQKFVALHKIGYPVILDTDNAVSNTYGVQYIPTSFFIDKEGVIQAEVQIPLYGAMIPQYLHKIGYNPR